MYPCRIVKGPAKSTPVLSKSGAGVIRNEGNMPSSGRVVLRRHVGMEKSTPVLSKGGAGVVRAEGNMPIK